jgi:exodeoxyribonuclease VII small subunit
MSKAATPPLAVESFGFEQAMAELESIVQMLERGDVALEQSITLYARGEALKARCDTLLRQAEMNIEQIPLTADGQAGGTTPFQTS